MSKSKPPDQPPKTPKLTRRDVDLWRAMTAEVEAYGEQPYVDAVDEGDKKRAGRGVQKKAQEVVFSKESVKKPSGRSSQLDRRTEERFRKGQMKIEARLDLHGMRQVEAYEAFTGFIERSSARGLRCVLVITGKGKGGMRTDDPDWLAPKGGVLKARLMDWLAEERLQSLVLKAAPAQPKDGGSGAFYILLRRAR